MVEYGLNILKSKLFFKKKNESAFIKKNYF